MAASLTSWQPAVLSLLRVAAALAYLAHGTQKYLSFPPRGYPAPELFSMLGAAGVIELVGGTLLVLGMFTRPVAFICSGMMAVGYFTVHFPQSIFPTVNGGDAAYLFCFIFFYLAFAGGGSISVDALYKRS